MLFNPVIVSVFVMAALSLLRINVIFALIIAALTAGVMTDMGIVQATSVMISGMGGQSETALSYVLLGIFAVMIGISGITSVLVSKILRVFSTRKLVLVFSIAAVSCLSQNVVPVHIAFIPILIPPLLVLFDRMKLDRRAVACALAFGLEFPYVAIPVGFGLIFQSIIRDEMVRNGMEITLLQVSKAMIIPGLSLIVGLCFALLITYRKASRKPKNDYALSVMHEIGPSAQSMEGEKVTWKLTHTFAIIAILLALVVQIMTDSLVLGALVGIMALFASRIVKIHEGEQVVNEGITMMGMIAFVMLVASGYASVLTESGAIEELVEQTLEITGYSHFSVAFFLLAVGLLVTMGIGTSFGTVPVVAAIYVPVLMAVGMSPLASAALIGTAGALGDAGSPASDTTLGPTAGLNADGRHHHIWDTCVPTFLHYNIPLYAAGLIAAVTL